MQPDFRQQVDPAGIGEIPNRTRKWMPRFLGGRGDRVIVRHYVVDLHPEEDLRDYPETYEMSWAEWEKRCGDYGLTVDGKPV